MKIIADSSLPKLADFFPDPFTLTFYASENELITKIQDQAILICRSTLKVNAKILANTHIQCVGTASSGIDHIDTQYLKHRSITLYDAKGSNAKSVADYVTAALAFLETQQIIQGNKAGVIGFGETGQLSQRRLQAAGYETYIYDPYQGYENIAPLFTCNLLCIHANLHKNKPWPSENLLNSQFLSRLKPNTCIINTARGGILNETDLLNSPIKLHYCVDVFAQEPQINPAVVEYATLCTPHIAGHSIEAKINAIRFLSKKIHHYYQLTPPALLEDQSLSQPSIESKLRQNNWQEAILNLYNPSFETKKLKQQSDKQLAFLTLRRSHTKRHDFDYYCL